MKIVFLIMGILLLGYVFRKIEVKWRKQKTQEKNEQEKKSIKFQALKELKELKKYDENGYERETADAIIAFNEKIELCMESIIKEEKLEDNYKKAEELKEEGEELKNKMKESHKKIEETLQKMEEKVTYIKEYLDGTNFYPPQFALDNNKLNGMIVEINDRKRENPFINLTKYIEFSDKLMAEVKEFQEQHQVVVKIINKINDKKQHFSKEKETKVLEMKNDLSIHLHKGEMDKVRKLVKELKKII